MNLSQNISIRECAVTVAERRRCVRRSLDSRSRQEVLNAKTDGVKVHRKRRLTRSTGRLPKQSGWRLFGQREHLKITCTFRNESEQGTESSPRLNMGAALTIGLGGNTSKQIKASRQGKTARRVEGSARKLDLSQRQNGQQSSANTVGDVLFVGRLSELSKIT